MTAVQWTDFNYVLLDAAAMGTLFQEAAGREHRNQSLYSGASAKEMASVAPYLFEFEADSNLAAWLLPRCQGMAWAAFLRSAESARDLRMHLRKFLMVRTQEGKELYYRYYDPRVLRDTLPTFEPEIQRQFMGPVEKWLVESIETGTALCFQWQDARLRVESQKWR